MTIFKDYPYYPVSNVEEIIEQLRQITNIRKDDISTIQNLPNVFLLGRKVGKIPSASNDVTNGDKLGDLSYSADFLYILVDNAGTAQWRRVALSSW